MFPVTKDEATALFKAYPDKPITICSKRKKSSGKTYWCSENAAYKTFIAKMRESSLEVHASQK